MTRLQLKPLLIGLMVKNSLGILLRSHLLLGEQISTGVVAMGVEAEVAEDPWAVEATAEVVAVAVAGAGSPVVVAAAGDSSEPATGSVPTLHVRT